MPKTYPRVERVERLARQVLGEALLDLKDPRIGFATVTSVKMTPDLRNARVYVSVLGSPEVVAASLEGIRHASHHLRTELGREVRLKFLPTLEILEDTTAAYGERIETLLREAGVSQAGSALGAGPTDARLAAGADGSGGSTGESSAVGNEEDDNEEEEAR